MSERTEALFKKAVAEHLAGRPEAASRVYEIILRDDPRDFRALHLNGAAAYQLDRMEASIGLFQRALKVRPSSGQTLICLGVAFLAVGRIEDADKSLKAGLALEPRNPEAWFNVGVFLLVCGKNSEAASCFRRAIKLRPGYAAALVGIGDIEKAEGRSAEAVARYREALRSEPGSQTARLGLVQALQSSNCVAEALAECDVLLTSNPAHVRARSSRLFLLNYGPDLSAERLFAEHLAYGRLFPPAPQRAFANSKNLLRRLRVAFLSPDLRTHSVASFLEPLLAHMDQAMFEIVLYHDHARVDAVSARLRSHAAIWREFAGRSDAFVESVIRSDSPDVIFDLAGHTGQNRLQLFARRLAPVQISYLGYPNTTGVAEIDYRFSDAIADPPGESDRLSTEKLVRFSPCAWSYEPPAEADAAGPIPLAGADDVISFGSFNNLCKVNDLTLRLWGQTLAAVPGSRLVVKALGLEPDSALRRMAGAGIDLARVSLLPPVPDVASHFASYRHIDIALDPFPYGGATTTCEALWMGRPVVSLSGDRHSSRVGASLLAAVGRPQWAARTPGEFTAIASSLAGNRAILQRESACLRGAMRLGPLMDHHQQARRLEAAIRGCWARWCEKPAHGAESGQRAGVADGSEHAADLVSA